MIAYCILDAQARSRKIVDEIHQRMKANEKLSAEEDKQMAGIVRQSQALAETINEMETLDDHSLFLRITQNDGGFGTGEDEMLQIMGANYKVSEQSVGSSTFKTFTWRNKRRIVIITTKYFPDDSDKSTGYFHKGGRSVVSKSWFPH